MKNIITALLFITLIFVSCKSGDSGTNNNEENPGVPFDLVKSQTITSAGGTIETNDLSLSVAPNATSTPVTLDLYTSQQQLDAPSAVTKLFKISGASTVNLSYIKLKYTGTLAGSNYIVWSEDNYVKSANKVAASKFFIPARDSSGYLVAKLSDISSQLSKGSGFRSVSASGFFYAMTGQAVLNSGTHFKVIYPTASATQAQDLATYLETAYTLLEGYGFNFVGRDWPAEVYLQKFDGWLNQALQLDNSAYGYYLTSTKNPLYIAYRTNNCSMYFNLNLMGSQTEMKATAGHEFFHAVQDLYDLRDPVTKKWNAPIQTWIDEACAVWFEGKMNTGSVYPVSLSGNELAFTEGMHVTGTNAQNHGYGMAPMIKYIVAQKGTSALSTIYNKMSLGTHPVEAVFSTVNPAGSVYNTDWYNNFLKEYITGGIYSIPAVTIGDVAANRRYESKALTDTLTNFPSVSYKDFSEQFYYVSLTYPDINQKSVSVNFKTNSTTSKIHLFKYANSANSLLKSGGSNGELTLTPADVKTGLAGGNKLYILALVTNNDYTSGFQGSKDISMTVKINYNAGPSIVLQPAYWEGRVNESKMFSITSTNLPQRYRYDWTWGDGNSESTTQPSGVHAYSSAGVYTISVSLYDLDLNQSVATAESTAKVADNPARITPDNSEGIINTGYQWTVVTDYTLTNARYEWDFGDGSSKTIQYNTKTASHTYTSTGNYSIKVDIYDNARNVKIESATTPFKVSEVSALLNSIRACRTVYLDGEPLVFGNGTEDVTLIYGAIHIDITWTGLNTFTGRYDQETSTSHETRTVSGSVSLDGQTVSIQWDDKETGLGEFTWYLNETIVNLTNISISSNRDNDSIAQYELHNSTSFTGSYKATAMTSDHTLKVYSIPRSSNIKFKFGLY